MNALLISLIALLALLVLLLFLPLEIRVDTRGKLYVAHYGNLLQARILPDPEEMMLLRLRFLFWTKQWSLQELRHRTADAPKPGKKTRSRRPGSRTFSPAKFLRLVRSFQLREFRLELDTGNPVLNAKLYPLFFLSGLHLGTTDLNFEGRNALALRLVNRPIRIITAWLNL